MYIYIYIICICICIIHIIIIIILYIYIYKISTQIHHLTRSSNISIYYIYIYYRERESSGMIRMVSTCHCHGKVAISYTRPDGQTFHAFLELSCAFRSVVWSRELVSLDASKMRQGFYAFQNADLRNLRSPDTCDMTDLFHFRISIHFIQSALNLSGHCPHFTWISRSTSQVEEVFGKFMVFHVGFTWVSHGFHMELFQVSQ